MWPLSDCTTPLLCGEVSVQGLLLLFSFSGIGYIYDSHNLKNVPVSTGPVLLRKNGSQFLPATRKQKPGNSDHKKMPEATLELAHAKLCDILSHFSGCQGYV